METKENTTTSHKALVKEHLKRFGSIDPITALNCYGCYRLSARISDLKAEGMDIKTTFVPHINMLGHKIKTTVYRYDTKAN